MSKQKKADGLLSHAAEVGGLGILAAPHVYHAVTGKKVSDKTERNSELAGLGVLAAPSVAHLGKAGFKALTKKAQARSVERLLKLAGPKDVQIPDRFRAAANTPAERAAAHGIRPTAAPQLTGLAKMKAVSQQPLEHTTAMSRKFLTRLASVKTASLVAGALSIFETE